MTIQSPSWDRFKRHYLSNPDINLNLDVSKVSFTDQDFETLKKKASKALESMQQLEKGCVANPDEGRMVGHYWLRNADLSPEKEQRIQIVEAISKIQSFVSKVHGGDIKGQGGTFKNLLVIGIGGSALGPQFVASALGTPGIDAMKPFFFDNTDPDGMDQTLAEIGDQLGITLSIVISKSGGTKETRNGMLEAKNAYSNAGLSFAKHAVAITSDDSELFKVATRESWIETFPMWDWVGGRTSELSAVGLLPAALQGIDIQAMLDGAKDCDAATRAMDPATNPAACLAMMWHHCGKGKGDKAMVILPYKDRLQLFSKYLQQLVMESLGKAEDLDGKKVEQGIAVYGNKGSTDQHAYIQQLRDGRNDFFATFIEVLKDRKNDSIEVEQNVTSGDYLSGFFLGTRRALHENDRDSITITIDEVSPRTVGILIALYERAVGLYASMININAYHQPGVEAGKKAAGEVIEWQIKILEYLKQNPGQPYTVDGLDEALGGSGNQETLFKICQHLSANPTRKIRRTDGKTPFDAQFSYTD
jgi:glucose-6-phosphate isomerase